MACSRKLAALQVLWMLALPISAFADESGVAARDVSIGFAVAESALESVRGRAEPQASVPASQSTQSSLSATVSGNTLTNGSTGANLTGAGVFGGASGIATMIQNSGNQVVIQTNVSVNLSLK